VGEGTGARVVRLEDDAYPSKLRDLRDPPAEIFLAGAWLAARPSVAIVGSRSADPDGCHLARHLAGSLASEGVVILSGLARGIDASAHEGALDAGGLSGAVLGTGLDEVYPRDHASLQERLRDSLGLMTERRSGSPPTRGAFVTRNRILAALAGAVVIVQGGDGSGAGHTAAYARELGRPVGAIPWDVFDRLGTLPNDLIRRGHATLVRHAEDVLALLEGEAAGGAPGRRGSPARGSSSRKASPRDVAALSPRESCLLAKLGARAVPLEDVAHRAGLSIAEAGAALSLLELLGLARREPGGAVRRVRAR